MMAVCGCELSGEISSGGCCVIIITSVAGLGISSFMVEIISKQLLTIEGGLNWLRIE